MNDTFTQRLIKAMTSTNIKQAELSELTGIAKSSISEYMSGTYEPKQKNIYKIATALNVAPSYLMGITNEILTSTLADKLKRLPANKQQELEQIINSNFIIITNPEEQNLIKKYRALDERGKQSVTITLDNEYRFLAREKEEDVLCS